MELVKQILRLHTIPTSQILWGMRPSSLRFNKPMRCFWWMQKNLRATVFNVVFKRGARCSSLRWYLPASFSLSSAAAAAKLLQLCPTLCNPIDGSPPGSLVLGILQARTLEWVAISFSNAWKWKVKVRSLSRFLLFTTPWTAAHQAPLSMRFSR